jgi:hypothetical protein
MGAETQRKRFPPSTEVEGVVSQLRPAIESAPLRLARFVSAPMRWPGIEPRYFTNPIHVDKCQPMNMNSVKLRSYNCSRYSSGILIRL